MKRIKSRFGEPHSVRIWLSSLTFEGQLLFVFCFILNEFAFILCFAQVCIFLVSFTQPVLAYLSNLIWTFVIVLRPYRQQMHEPIRVIMTH